MSTHRRLSKSLSIIVILTMLFSGVSLPSASAQREDSVQREVNPQTGKVSFIGPVNGSALSAAKALGTSARPQDPAMALAKRFGPEFGLQDAERDLAAMQADRPEDGRVIVHYQQKHQGIPVIGGELIVNTNERGDLYSINGEVSPGLSIPIQPVVDAEQARQTALQAVAKWYQGDLDAFQTSEPELWIFDESLLRPSTRPAELVWRTEVTSVNGSLPVRELVLVNAQRGGISLHFNQIDMAWMIQGGSGAIQAPDPTATPLPTETPLPAETPEPAATGLLATEETNPKEDGSASSASIHDGMILAAATWYVATTGSDSNSCSSTSSPCATINGAIAKATSEDNIKVASGTYTDTGTEVVLINKSVTISGGWDASFTAQSGISTIDGQGARRGVTVNSDIIVVLDRFTIQNGFDGGIRNLGTLTLNISTVTNNVTTGMGGGIYNYGTLIINNTAITGNTAGDSCCSGGGGGGGIASNNSNGSVTLNNSTVNGNTLLGGFPGSGISVWGTVTLNNSTVSGNTGGYGEGIAVNGGMTTLNNSTISGNQSYGIKNWAGTVMLRNTIIAGNGNAGDCVDTSDWGDITSLGHNLIGNISGCVFTSTTGDLVNVNPKLGELIGFPGSKPLLLGSPAINAGNPAIPGSGGNACLATDQRGVIRPVGVRCDIGAYEYTPAGNVASLSIVNGNGQRTAPTLVFFQPLEVVALDQYGGPVAGVNVTFTAPQSGASGIFAGTNSITATSITNGSGVATAPAFTANSLLGTYTVIASASGVDSISFNLQNFAWFVTTNGNDTNSCTVPASPCETINGAINKASNTETDPILVATGTYTGTGSEVVLVENKSIVLSGGWNVTFTVQSSTSTIDGEGARHGVATNSNANVVIEHFTVQNGFGTGIYNYDSSLTLNNSFVIDNVSLGSGGGILNHGTLTVNNTTIRNNTGGDPCCSGGGGGGGIENQFGTVTLNNSLVSGNKLLGGFSGSGIHSGPGTVILNNSTVSGNTGGDGSGIYVFVGNILLKNSTISFNESYGVRNEAGNITVQNTIIAKNGSGRDCSGTMISQGHNLVGNNTGCTFSSISGDVIGTSANPVSPRLTALQDNGGSNYTHALMSGSPAIDAGNPITCLSTDQRGIARPAGARCDIGAYEGSMPWVPTPLVNTYSNGPDTLPGDFLCNQTDPLCVAGDAHAKAAHQYAIGTYNFYASQYSRDSIDNAGMTIISTVHYCAPYDGCPYSNAFWNGAQVVYGDAYGFALADDVVAHELTHGVTQYESNLFYYYQSGAINESFSDLWGEYYDQTNSLGNDTVGVKWLIGEDVSGQGATRSLSNPPAYNDPDKMSSPHYYESEADSGGVHTNSGINNKAVYLMVDGGTFNGKTVTALGWEKTAAIYYEVNTNLLFSGADYSDLYYALQQACTNLVGQKGITAANCAEVKDAIDAVEMNSQPAPNFNMDTPLCSGITPVIAFADDLETGTAKWSFSNGAYTRWQYDSPYGPYAQSGRHFLYADDYPAIVTDASARLASVVVPNNAYLHFAHAYDFESGYNIGDPTFYNFDGGVLEYSLNGGSSWTDAGSLMEANGYKGTLFSGAGNPLSGRSAFVGSSHGYISTRLNLASLAGQTVTFRWRMGLDEAGFAWGWWVDNVKVYTCSAPATFNDVANTHWAWNFVERLYNAGITGGCNTNPLQYCPDGTVTRAQMAIFLLRGIHGSSYNPPGVGGSTGFADVPTSYWAAGWIKQLTAEGITSGCGFGNYCPESPVTRAQMAIFLLRSKYGASYSPPAVGSSTGFSDVLLDYWAGAWIKQLVTEGITAGCGAGVYCPEAPVTRAQMAVFLVKTFNLP